MRALLMAVLEASWYKYACSLLAISVTYYLYTKSRRRLLPPGPTPLPFVGSALGILGRPLHVTFAMLQKKYGDIFSLRVAGVEVVVINGYDNIRDALVTQGRKFNGRPDITWTSLTQKHGIFSIEGKDHKTQRSLSRKILTDINWDKQEAAESRIQKVATDLIGWLVKEGDQPVNPQIFLDTAVCNVTSQPLMGVTFKPTDDLMIAVSKIAMDIFIDAGAQNVNNYFTFLRHLPGDPTNYIVLKNNATTAMNVLAGVITNHKDKVEENGDTPRVDFIDHYLAVMRGGSEPTCTDQQLLATVTDLFAMGIEATATTLRWAVLLMCHYPDVQNRIQRDIDEVMGDSVPTLKHEQEMSYTNAAIAEIQRYINLVSVNLPHSTTEDVTFRGYEIPRGAVVLPNLASIHYDEETYANPISFQPDRFLEDGEFRKHEKFLPYSAGTRACLGKNISHWQIFLFLTAILQRFDVRLDGTVGSEVYGLIRYPGEFKCVFNSRKSPVTINNN